MHPTMQRVYMAFEAVDGYNPFKRQTSLGKLLNESNQTVKNWEQRGVSKNALDKIAKLYAFNPEWIMTGEGYPHLENLIGQIGNKLISRHVPLVNFKDVDRLLEGTEDPHEYVVCYLPCPIRHSEKTFAIVLQSEHRGFMPHEVVFIDPTKECNIGDDVLARINIDGQYNVLRKVSNDERGEQFLLALSDSSLPRIVYMNDSTIIGKAICAMRKL